MAEKIIKNITLAFMGQSKCAKTTSIGMLTKFPEMVAELSRGDGGRTKTSVIWHIVPNQEFKYQIESIDVIIYNIIGPTSVGTLEKYNENIDKHPFLKDILNFEKQTDTNINLLDYVYNKLNEFCNRDVSIDELKKLITTECMKDYIKKIVIKIAANPGIEKFIKSKNIDLNVVDTRGLLDIATNDNMIEKGFASSAYDLAIDRLDGIVYFCSDEVLNIIEMYEDIFKNTFKSVPLFLVFPNDKNLFKNYKSLEKYGKMITEEKVDEFIKELQDGNNEDYDNIDIDYFLPTLTFLANDNLRITAKVENDGNVEYEFVDEYLDKKASEYLLPYCRTLRDYENMKQMDFENDEDLKFLQVMTYMSIESIICHILDLQNAMRKLFKEEILYTILVNQLMKIAQYDDDDKSALNIHNDALLYGLNILEIRPIYTKPNLKNFTRDELIEKISDENVENIGSKGGITLSNNGKLVYSHTVVVAVTALQWLYSEMIDGIKYEDLVEFESIFKKLKLKKEKVVKLVKKLLFTIAYRILIDKNATLRNYYIANRYYVDGAIKYTRENLSEVSNPFEYSVICVLARFSIDVKTMSEFPDFEDIVSFESDNVNIHNEIKAVANQIISDKYKS